MEKTTNSDGPLTCRLLFVFQSSSVELARCVLAEVPKQVTDYYKMRNMQPNKPRTQQPNA